MAVRDGLIDVPLAGLASVTATLGITPRSIERDTGLGRSRLSRTHRRARRTETLWQDAFCPLHRDRFIPRTGVPHFNTPDREHQLTSLDEHQNFAPPLLSAWGTCSAVELTTGGKV